MVRGVPITDFYPFGGSEDSRLSINAVQSTDDQTVEITLTTPFVFYGRTYKRIYLNDNGYFTLGAEENAFEPEHFPRENLSVPIIAPYWQDFDIQGTGEIFYRQMSDSLTTTRVSFEVLVTFGVLFTPKVVLIATWDHVGYYQRQHDKTNTLQAVLSTDGERSFVVFLYLDNGIQWTSGDASLGVNGLGGITAQVGFDSGDGVNFLQFADAMTEEIVHIENTSNIGDPGYYIFAVHEKPQIDIKKATATETVSSTVTPNSPVTVTQTLVSTTTIAKKIVTSRVTTTDTVILAMELSTTTVVSQHVVTTTVTTTSTYAKLTTTKTITVTMATEEAVLPPTVGSEKIVTSPLPLHLHVAWMVVAIALLCIAAVTCTFGLTAFAVYLFRWKHAKPSEMIGKTSIGERYSTLKDVVFTAARQGMPTEIDVYSFTPTDSDEDGGSLPSAYEIPGEPLKSNQPSANVHVYENPRDAKKPLKRPSQIEEMYDAQPYLRPQQKTPKEKGPIYETVESLPVSNERGTNQFLDAPKHTCLHRNKKYKMIKGAHGERKTAEESSSTESNTHSQDGGEKRADKNTDLHSDQHVESVGQPSAQDLDDSSSAD